MRKIIITGSEGIIGSSLINEFKDKDVQIACFDKDLGHDLSNEKEVIDLMKDHEDYQYLINLFALNDHVIKGKNKSNLFDIDLDSITDYCNINLVSLFSVCRAFAKFCNATSIVNFSSLYGVLSPKKYIYDKNNEKHIGYTITKHGVIGLSRHLSTHISPIRVNCIVPGGVETIDQSEDFKLKYNKNVPLGRMLKANELFGIINLLCSDKSSYINGSIINVDGGWTSW
tara:strand:+ start:54 stop:737 length:684 start_codon:yes stop_codon:yes gene_type:complete